MAAAQDTNVHLEAMEAAENAGEEPHKAGNAGMAGSPEWKHPKRLLGGCRKWKLEAHHNKRETRTSRIL